jgi:nicotinamide mononucleotide transporter PnuC
MKLIASLIGVTSLIFLAKGNPFGNVLMIIFSVLYAIISYSFLYYGEMITYVGMTAPMALFSLVSWLKNTYGKSKSQVKVRKLTPKIFILGAVLTAVVTVVFYYILSALNTANIVPSTISVLTSFFAAYLTFMRTPYFPLAYAFNDIVLIVMWAMATKEDTSYISVIVCFCVFLVNDLYGFINWCRMRKTQKQGKIKV